MKKSLSNVIKSNTLAEVQLTYKTKVKASDRQTIKDSKQAEVIFRPLFDENTIEHVESCVLLLLNRTSQVLGWCKISTGGVAGTVVDMKVVFQLALNANASGIILAHNHPSGNLQPSNEDIKVTKAIREAGKILDINLLDHLILTSEGYVSMADEGHI